MSNEDRFQLRIKEWELCQNNLQRHNQWFWQTGSIFIALSLAALWAFSQISESLSRQWFPVFSIFSISTILIWYLFIARRAMKFSKITREVLREVERELSSDLNLKSSLLHTRIQESDRCTILRAKYGVYLFIILIIGIWVLTYHILFAS